MADKELSIVNGQVGNVVVKPLFENVNVVGDVVIDTDASDFKGLVTLGDLVADSATGLLTVPLTAIAVGVQEATIVFQYTKAGAGHEDTPNWGTSTRTINLTITAAEVAASLADVSTPLTMDLWATQPLTFKVMKGDEDISSSVTSVTVDAASIADKFEFSIVDGVDTFKSIQSSESEVVTATAKVTIAGTDNGEAYSLEADVVLNTNINDGSIPTNRFDVQMEQ
ncbi:hypothetical protein AH04_195 [Erwinia phage AH04]|uniref:Uncharacterized protein n=1 Tax=Erwinia phage AH04 TaxID=2869569 RepID=A0AAE7X0P6_9CAUD|nr:hypothetical protein PQC02_gp119 [Erwinia phage AH04]QZA70670.1 hypothetical protein AH04_195 [Erwinia phage AH04]